MDIVVTTPKNDKSWSDEVKDCRTGKATHYFRVFASRPKCNVGDKIYYCQDGAIRGYCVIDKIEELDNHKISCLTTGLLYSGKIAVYARADSWVAITPIPMVGFRGYRYFDRI